MSPESNSFQPAITPEVVGPAAPLAAAAPPRPTPPAPRGSRWVVRLLIVLLLGSCFLNFALFKATGLTSFVADSDSALQEKYHSLSHTASDKIAILSIEGVIMDGDGFVKQQIDRIKKDEHVKGIVLRINSPGGLVSSSDYMYHHLQELLRDRKIPLVVSMGDIAASGGYYVAMAAGEQAQPDPKQPLIFAEPTTWTGSIGVLIPHYDLSQLAEKYGVHDDSIKSHELKAMGGMVKAMTPQERAIFQELVTEMFTRFKDVVKAGRPGITDEKLTEVATGQVFTANQAKKHGLVDEIGFIEDAVKQVTKMAGLSESDVRVVSFKSQPTLTDMLLGSARARQPSPGLDVNTLLEMSVPRAFYLYSNMPALAAVGHRE